MIKKFILDVWYEKNASLSVEFKPAIKKICNNDNGGKRLELCKFHWYNIFVIYYQMYQYLTT